MTPTDNDRRIAEAAASEATRQLFPELCTGLSDDTAEFMRKRAIILAAAEKIAEERVKELEKDKERLDWLDEKASVAIPCRDTFAKEIRFRWASGLWDDVRDAIDAARAKEESR